MKEEGLRLNPFAYIPETDIRFYLLVLFGVLLPALWALGWALVVFYWLIAANQIEWLETTIVARLLIMVFLTSLILLLIYWSYRRQPKKIIRRLRLKELDGKKFPDHDKYIGDLYREYLSTEKHPTLMYQPLDRSESAFTFGTKHHNYVGVSGGLITRFRKSIDDFKSIILHEMGHIANKDVEKTYLAASTWRSLFLTLLIPLGILLLWVIYLSVRLIHTGIRAGYGLERIVSDMELAEWTAVFGPIVFTSLFMLVIIYVLRNQIIRLREFYADARVLEWEKSGEMLEKTLREFGGEQYSRFQILTKFHPSISERIKVLKNNLRFFSPSLWVAFSIGFYYGVSRLLSGEFYMYVLSDDYWVTLSEGTVYYFPDSVFTLCIRFVSILIFPILMIAVSSSFHRSILRAVFIDKKCYFSINTLFNIVTFSMVFSLGWMTILIFTNRPWEAFSLDNLRYWALHALDFSIVLLFLSFFASMLIRRSFSRKVATNNFLIVTFASASLFVVNYIVAIQILDNRLIMLVFLLVFSVAIYTFIKIRDRRLSCPNCGNKISNPSRLKLDCPNCRHGLYSWAIYSFS